MKINKTRFYAVAAVLSFLTSVTDLLTGGTFTAVVYGGFAVAFLCGYAAAVEDSVKYDGLATYW